MCCSSRANGYAISPRRAAKLERRAAKYERRAARSQAKRDFWLAALDKIFGTRASVPQADRPMIAAPASIRSIHPSTYNAEKPQSPSTRPTSIMTAPPTYKEALKN